MEGGMREDEGRMKGDKGRKEDGNKGRMEEGRKKERRREEAGMGSANFLKNFRLPRTPSTPTTT
jgi:hypothetical protein